MVFDFLWSSGPSLEYRQKYAHTMIDYFMKSSDTNRKLAFLYSKSKRKHEREFAKQLLELAAKEDQAAHNISMGRF